MDTMRKNETRLDGSLLNECNVRAEGRTKIETGTKPSRRDSKPSGKTVFVFANIGDGELGEKRRTFPPIL